MISRKVPYYDYTYVFRSQEAEYTRIFLDVCRRGAFIAQKDLADFEQELCRYTGARYAVGVADGTAALIVALQAIGLKPDEEVIFCSHTMVATAAAIHFVGGIPVPVEVGPDREMDLNAAERAITSKTRGLLPTQLNGRTCNMDGLRDLANKHGLWLVEDAAQALGAKFRGRMAGTFGRAGTLSFYPAKTLGCFGDGGAVLTNEEDVYKTILQLRDHGRESTGVIRRWGLNSRLDNLQAAFLLHRLKNYEQEIEHRRSLARVYQAMLADLSELNLPPAVDSDERYRDIFQNYEIEADRRSELREFLAKEGIGTLIQWGGSPVHAWEGLGFKDHLPVTERFFERCLMLPMNSAVGEDDVSYVCEKIRKFYRS